MPAQEPSKKEALVRQAASGDPGAFTALFHEHIQGVYNYAYSLCQDPLMAEDVTQEAFIRAHANLDSLGPPWNFQAWMLRLARNVFLNMVQRERRLEPLRPDVQLPSVGPNPEEQAMLRDVGLRVRRVMQSLADRHREVLLLREVYGFAYAEIADHMEISLDAVKVLLHRARNSFRQAYGFHALVEEPGEQCAQFAELLEAMQDGETTPGQERLVRNHLKECRACSERKELLVSQAALLALMPLAPPPAGLNERILEQFGEGPTVKRRRLSRRGRAWRIAGGAALGLGLAAVFMLGAERLFSPNPAGGPAPGARQRIRAGIPLAYPFRARGSQLPPTLGVPSEAGDCTYTALVNLVCRQGPDSLYTPLDSFAPGQSGLVVGQNRDGSFLYVVGPNNGAVCAVPSSADFAALAGECRHLPQFTPPPPVAPTSTPAPPPQPTATATPEPPGAIAGLVWKDTNFDGVRQGSEPGYANVTVRLGQGACSSTGFMMAVSASNGSFSFPNLPAGAYCVSVNIAPVCGDYTAAATPAEYTVNLVPGGSESREFGYQILAC